MRSSILFSFTIVFCLTAFRLQAQMTPTYEVDIPMRDGKTLAADVYVPNACTTGCPTILIQTPYNKNNFRNGLPLGFMQNLQSSPYTWVIADWRGFYGSMPAAVTQPERGKDGYDIIEWITQQTWSDGKVGTWGPSALGVIQYQTAREKHPAHICAVPLVAAPDQSYAQYYYGGVLEIAYLAQLDALGYGLSVPVLSNPYYSNIWQVAESNSRYPQDIEIPTLQIGGWYDHNIDRMIRWYDATRNLAALPVRNAQWLLVGPWVHGGTGSAYVGSVQQGQLSYPNAAFKSDSMARDFFDHYLRNQNPAWLQTPLCTWYETGKDQWTSGADIQIQPVDSGKLYLHPGGLLAAQSASTGETAFDCDPRNPAPTLGGQTLSIYLDQGPHDQTPLLSRNDLITFNSGALFQDVQMHGKMKVKVYVSCDQPDADIAIRVTDIYPDGRHMLVHDGITRMRLRNGYRLTDEAFMQAGTVYPAEIHFPFMDYTWKAGHAIEIILSGNHALRWNVNPHNQTAMYTTGDTNIARITIHHNTQYPSAVMIPGNNPALQIEQTSAHDAPLKIYPNPAKRTLWIESVETGMRYEIWDISGQCMQSGILSQDCILLDDLAAGMYILKLTGSSGFRASLFQVAEE
jgi:uncharacterized protein